MPRAARPRLLRRGEPGRAAGALPRDEGVGEGRRTSEEVTGGGEEGEGEDIRSWWLRPPRAPFPTAPRPPGSGWSVLQHVPVGGATSRLRDIPAAPTAPRPPGSGWSVLQHVPVGGATSRLRDIPAAPTAPRPSGSGWSVLQHILVFGAHSCRTWWGCLGASDSLPGGRGAVGSVAARGMSGCGTLAPWRSRCGWVGGGDGGVWARHTRSLAVAVRLGWWRRWGMSGCVTLAPWRSRCGWVGGGVGVSGRVTLAPWRSRC